MNSDWLLFILGLGMAAAGIIWTIVDHYKKSHNQSAQSKPKPSPQGNHQSTTFEQQQRLQKGFKVFISYRRNDSADVTGRIYDRLIQHFGQLSIFKDVDAIPLGVDFRARLDEAVGKCNVLIAVIGNHWLAQIDSDGNHRLNDPRDFVRIEIEAALKRRIPVIPVLVQGASMPSTEDLPSSLSELVFRNGIPIRPDPDFHKDMDRLVKGIEAHL